MSWALFMLNVYVKFISSCISLVHRWRLINPYYIPQLSTNLIITLHYSLRYLFHLLNIYKPEDTNVWSSRVASILAIIFCTCVPNQSSSVKNNGPKSFAI